MRILLLVITLLLVSCHAGQERGLSGNAYHSSSKPEITIEARGLAPLGCRQTTIKLMDAGVLGGLPMQAWLTVYGDNPMAVIGHGDLPPGWSWSPAQMKSFAVHEGWLDIGGKSYHAQTFLETPGKNPFVPMDDTAQAETWLIRSFSARYNNNRSKIVLQYREKSPIPLKSLSSMPYGYATLLEDFNRRAEKVFALSTTGAGQITKGPPPSLHTRFINENFFGKVMPITKWPLD